jgi:hypothetical protein
MTKDSTDTATIEIPGLPPPQKKRGRPSGPRPAATDKQRQQRLRERDEMTLFEVDSNQWNKRQCIMALANKKWDKTSIGEAAWRQLGKLIGYSM